ncbi:GNAT family N-acetyltransferase [Amycolatopsis sp. NBC_01286]|uniref:GNAT family N-acetyltransferase n=1 Tax=Amycolatopsis sp. NBC_01286 TaxID=2903560 RepID=UPI002E0FB953|nr:GNAT family N-acetyltransferase [Amycolatopsis sp. NBC_01286]
MTVSVCTAEEVPQLVASAVGLFAEDGGRHDPSVDVGWPAREGESYYAALVEDPAVLCLLVPGGGGHLVGRLCRPNPLRPGVVTADLESLRVDAGHRRAGIGAELVAAFFAWAKENGATETKVKAFAANEGALEFYRAQGFEPFEVILRRTS